MKSKPFIQKLNNRLDTGPIEEDIEMLLDIAGSLNSFQSQDELRSHLSEGSLLNISKIASKALSVPCGDYVVWTTDSGHTMLVPTENVEPDKEVFEDHGQSYEILTPNLLAHWNTVGRVLHEYTDSTDDPNFGTNQPDEGGKETEEGPHGQFQSKIHMASVDRSPIARAMEQDGHTVTSLAKAVGVDPPAISRILRTPKDTQGDPGGRNPSIGLAAKIANELKMDAEALFPDIFGIPKQDLEARDQPGNRGSGMKGAAAGSTRKGKATEKWTQGNAQ